MVHKAAIILSVNQNGLEMPDTLSEKIAKHFFSMATVILSYPQNK